MSTQSYYRIVGDIRRICPQLSLQLPTHKIAIAAQVRNIQQVCSGLELIKQKVHLLSYRAWNPIHREQYRVLDELLYKLLTEATNMTLLAEEFFYDPEGSLSCLREVNRRKAKLLERLRFVTEVSAKQGTIALPASLPLIKATTEPTRLSTR